MVTATAQTCNAVGSGPREATSDDGRRGSGRPDEACTARDGPGRGPDGREADAGEARTVADRPERREAASDVSGRTQAASITVPSVSSSLPMRGEPVKPASAHVKFGRQARLQGRPLGSSRVPWASSSVRTSPSTS